MSLLPRTPEPEVMDSEQEARDYDAMDHGDVNASFCVDLLAAAAAPAVACSTRARARRSSRSSFAAGRRRRGSKRSILRGTMLGAGPRATSSAPGWVGRIRLARRNATATGVARRQRSTPSCPNSLAHHVPEPLALFAELWRLGERRAASSSCAISRAQRTRRASRTSPSATRQLPDGRLVVRTAPCTLASALSSWRRFTRRSPPTRSARWSRSLGIPGLPPCG